MKKGTKPKRLAPKVKRFIVMSLAQYKSPSTVATETLDELGVSVTRQQVAVYNPDTRSGRKLSPDLRDLFARTRSTFNRDLDPIPIAQQVVRLRVLNSLAMRADQKGDLESWKFAVLCLEQAARELGGTYTNKFAARLEHVTLPDKYEDRDRERKPGETDGEYKRRLADVWARELNDDDSVH